MRFFEPFELPVEPSIPERIVNVEDFGAVPGGIIKNTDAISPYSDSDIASRAIMDAMITASSRESPLALKAPSKGSCTLRRKTLTKFARKSSRAMPRFIS